MEVIFAEKQENIKNEIIQRTLNLFHNRYKISILEQKNIYIKIKKNSGISSSELLRHEKDIKISAGQLNRIRKEWNVSRKKGRSRKKKANLDSEIEKISHIENVGMKLFCDWFTSESKHQKTLEIIYEKIRNYRNINPESNFRLLKSKDETIAKKWLAISILSLLGINKISELDYKQHNMKSVLGYSYGYSSLRQFLDHLERINVGNDLNMALVEQNKGQYIYIDGHMTAFWSKKKCIRA